MKRKFTGVVVLYNPNFELLIKNISSYIDELDILYITDNSDDKNDKFINWCLKQKNIEYIFLNGNKGIAKALNIAKNKAIEKNYNWLLTMDQDSYFEAKGVERIKSFILENERFYTENYAIISVYQKIDNRKEIKKKPYFVNCIMTSGNFLNLEIAKKLGDFDEKLFIDEVDHEYCYRIIQENYKILVLPEVKLIHNLGNLKDFKYFYITNHSAIRRYYKIRNKLYVASKYKQIRNKYILAIFKEFMKTLFFEKNKIYKIKFMLRGIKDFYEGNFGKYKERRKI